MIERVLIPLDGSELAQKVLAQARLLLIRQDAEVLLVRAVLIPPDLEAKTVELLEILKAQAGKYLETVARELTSQGARVRWFVRVGSAADAILDVAAEERASLIIMTTHGRTGLARWALGSVAEKVVRSSRVPVLAVRSFRKVDGAAVPAGPESLSFRRILLPTDGSPASGAALTPTLEFARLFGSEVVVLHVEAPARVSGGEIGVLAPTPPATPSLEDPVTAPAAERFRQAGVGVRRVTVLGDPASQILDEAAGADLIAMATHGRSGFSRWVLGSVAERVLRSAEVPLLLVRATGKGAEGPASAGRTAGTSS